METTVIERPRPTVNHLKTEHLRLVELQHAQWRIEEATGRRIARWSFELCLGVIFLALIVAALVQ